MSNLTYVEHEPPVKGEFNDMKYIRLVTVYVRGVEFLEAVRYEVEPRSRDIDEDVDDDEDLQELSESKPVYEDHVYIYSKLPNFTWSLSSRVQSVEEALKHAKQAEKELEELISKFAGATRRKLKVPIGHKALL